jgi:hypothetical protein
VVHRRNFLTVNVAALATTYAADTAFARAPKEQDVTDLQI